MEKPVACAVCDSEHRRLFSATQGVECASYSFERHTLHYILCGYGSVFDTAVFLFKRDPEEEFKKKRPLCDACIRSLIRRGFLYKLPGGYLDGIDYNHPIRDSESN